MFTYRVLTQLFYDFHTLPSLTKKKVHMKLASDNLNRHIEFISSYNYLAAAVGGGGATVGGAKSGSSSRTRTPSQHGCARQTGEVVREEW